MITINKGKITIPKEEVFIGFTGDNSFLTRQFLFVGDTNENTVYRLYLKFDDGTYNYLTLDSEQTQNGVLLSWKIMREHILKGGTVLAQIKVFIGREEIYHTETMSFLVLDSIENTNVEGEFTPSDFDRLEEKLNSTILKIENERCKLPQISEDNTWLIYNPETKQYEDSKISCVGEAAQIDTEAFERKTNKTNSITLGQPSGISYPTEEAVVNYTCAKFLDNDYVVSDIPDDRNELDDGDVLTAKSILVYTDSKFVNLGDISSKEQFPDPDALSLDKLYTGILTGDILSELEITQGNAGFFGKAVKYNGTNISKNRFVFITSEGQIFSAASLYGNLTINKNSYSLYECNDKFMASPLRGTNAPSGSDGSVGMMYLKSTNCNGVNERDVFMCTDMEIPASGGSPQNVWTQMEISDNKVVSLSAESTDTQYPSAKCVYDLVGNIESLLAQI